MTVPGFTRRDDRNITDNTVAEISAGECALDKIIWHNDDASARFLQIFNARSADVTLGTTTPDFVLQLGADSSESFDFNGAKFGTALSIAVTTTATGSTGGTSSWVMVTFT